MACFSQGRLFASLRSKNVFNEVLHGDVVSHSQDQTGGPISIRDRLLRQGKLSRGVFREENVKTTAPGRLGVLIKEN